METMTHYEHLAQMFPFEDDILVNRRCARIVRFDHHQGWQRARQHMHHVRIRLRMVIVRIMLINVRLGIQTSIRGIRPNAVTRTRIVPLRDIVPEHHRNQARIKKWYRIARSYIGAGVAYEMMCEVEAQAWQVWPNGR